MTRNQIDKLISEGVFPEPTEQRELVETHISWVILCDAYVYKIKKPIKYSFLDFSTLERRKHFCKRELELNQRFSKGIYLEVLPVYEHEGGFYIGGKKGVLIDFALKMRKLDSEKQMDILLRNNNVSAKDIKNLATCIVNFHNNTTIIYKKNVLDIKEKFNDLGADKEFLSKKLGEGYGKTIEEALVVSNTFLNENKELLENRLHSGFFRDCHGDLHARNIFLLPEPQPFDCIEFNESYRQIDLLNEVAFLCMDLDALGRKDLSDMFIAQYNLLFPAIRNKAEKQLFSYYKSYRANVRAKVNSLRAKSASNNADKTIALAEVKRYIALMDSYLKSLDTR